MAVYKHGYRGYEGPRVGGTRRWLILTRSGIVRLFASKLLLLFLALCTFYPLLCILYIYILHNPNLLLLLQMRPGNMLAIDGRFFFSLCYVQGLLALLLTAVIGPGLISPDIVNGALPLYFSRLFSRWQYAAGKLCVLMFLLSIITWAPVLFVYVMRGAIMDWAWESAHLYLAFGIFIGLLAWIFMLSMIALAMSAWVKWRVTASAMVLAIFFAGAGFGAVINSVMRTQYGTLIDLSGAMHIAWADLLRYDLGTELPASEAWMVVLLVCAICAWLMNRRIRTFEVVK